MSTKQISTKKISVSIILVVVGSFLLISPALAGGVPAEDLNKLVRDIFVWIIMASGLLAFGIVVYGGIRYLTSAGSRKAIEGAKKSLKKGGTGLIIILLIVVLLNWVNPAIFKGVLPITDPGESPAEVPYQPRPELENIYQEIPFGTIIESRLFARNMSCYNKWGELINCKTQKEFTDAELNTVKQELREGSLGQLPYQFYWSNADDKVGAYPNPTEEEALGAFKCYKFDDDGNIIYQNDTGKTAHVGRMHDGTVKYYISNGQTVSFDPDEEDNFLAKNKYKPVVLPNQDRMSCMKNTIRAFDDKASAIEDSVKKIKDWTGGINIEGCACWKCICPDCAGWSPTGVLQKFADILPKDMQDLLKWLKPENVDRIRNTLKDVTEITDRIEKYLEIDEEWLLNQLASGGAPDWVKNAAGTIADNIELLRNGITRDNIYDILHGLSDEGVEELRQGLANMGAGQVYDMLMDVQGNVDNFKKIFQNLSKVSIKEIARILGYEQQANAIADLESQLEQASEEELQQIRQQIDQQIAEVRAGIENQLDNITLNQFKEEFLERFTGYEEKLLGIINSIYNGDYLKDLLAQVPSADLADFFQEIPLSDLQNILKEVSDIADKLGASIQEVQGWLANPVRKLEALISNLSDEAIEQLMDELMDEAVNPALNALINTLFEQIPIGTVLTFLRELPFKLIEEAFGNIECAGCSGDPCLGYRDNINNIREYDFKMNQVIDNYKARHADELVDIPFEKFGHLNTINQTRYIGYKVLVPQKAGLRADLDYLQKAKNLFGQCRYGTIISQSELEQKIKGGENIKINPFCYNQKEAQWGEICVPQERANVQQYCDHFNCADCPNQLSCDLDQSEQGQKIQKQIGNATYTSYKCSNYGINNEKGENERAIDDEQGTLCKTVTATGTTIDGYTYDQDPFTFYCPYPGSEKAKEQEAYHTFSDEFSINNKLDDGYQVSKIPVGEVIAAAEKLSEGIIRSTDRVVHRSLAEQNKEIYNPQDPSDKKTLYNLPNQCTCACEPGVVGCNCVGCTIDIGSWISKMLKAAVGGLLKAAASEFIDELIPTAEDVKDWIRDEIRDKLAQWIREKAEQGVEDFVNRLPLEELRDLAAVSRQQLQEALRKVEDPIQTISHLSTTALRDVLVKLNPNRLRSAMSKLALNQWKELINQLPRSKLEALAAMLFPEQTLEAAIEAMEEASQGLKDQILDKLDVRDLTKLLYETSQDTVKAILQYIPSEEIDALLAAMPLESLRELTEKLPQEELREIIKKFNPEWVANTIDQWVSSQIRNLIELIPKEWLEDLSGIIENIFKFIKFVRDKMEPVLKVMDWVQDIAEWISDNLGDIIQTAQAVLQVAVMIVSFLGGNPCVCVCTGFQCPSINMGPCPSVDIRTLATKAVQWLTGDSEETLDEYHQNNMDTMTNKLEPEHQLQETLLKITRNKLTKNEIVNLLQNLPVEKRRTIIDLPDDFSGEFFPSLDPWDVISRKELLEHVTPWETKETMASSSAISPSLMSIIPAIHNDQKEVLESNHQNQIDNLVDYEPDIFEGYETATSIQDVVEDQIQNRLDDEETLLQDKQTTEKEWMQQTLPNLDGLGVNIPSKIPNLKSKLQNLSPSGVRSLLLYMSITRIQMALKKGMKSEHSDQIKALRAKIKALKNVKDKLQHDIDVIELCQANPTFCTLCLLHPGICETGRPYFCNLCVKHPESCNGDVLHLCMLCLDKPWIGRILYLLSKSKYSLQPGPTLAEDVQQLKEDREEQIQNTQQKIDQAQQDLEQLQQQYEEVFNIDDLDERYCKRGQTSVITYDPSTHCPPGYHSISRKEMIDVFTSSEALEKSKEIRAQIGEWERTLTQWKKDPSSIPCYDFPSGDPTRPQCSHQGGGSYLSPHDQQVAIQNLEQAIEELWTEKRPIAQFINIIPDSWAETIIENIPATTLTSIILHQDEQATDTLSSLDNQTRQEILSYLPQNQIENMFDQYSLAQIKNEAWSIPSEGEIKFLLKSINSTNQTYNDLMPQLKDEEIDKMMRVINATETDAALSHFSVEPEQQLGQILKDLPVSDQGEIFPNTTSTSSYLNDKIDEVVASSSDNLYDDYLQSNLSNHDQQTMMTHFQHTSTKKDLLKGMPAEELKTYLKRAYQNKAQGILDLNQAQNWEQLTLQQRHQHEILYARNFAHIIFREVTEIQPMVEEFENGHKASINGIGNWFLNKIGGWWQNGDDISYFGNNDREIVMHQVLTDDQQATPAQIAKNGILDTLTGINQASASEDNGDNSEEVSRTEIINKLSNVRKKLQTCVKGYGSTQFAQEAPKELFRCSILTDKLNIGEMTISRGVFSSCYPYHGSHLTPEQKEACATNPNGAVCKEAIQDFIDNYYCLTPVQP